jgi:hypothetical protein
MGTRLFAAVLAAASLCATPAFAQFGGTQFGAPPQQQFAPATGQSVPPPPPPNAPIRLAPPGQAATPPAAAPAAPQQNALQVPAGQAALTVSARFGGPTPQPITNGLTWRVYPAKPDARGFRPVKEDKNSAPTFTLPQGDYVVHVSFGMASAVRNVSLRSDTAREVFDLPAGGIRLEGRVGEVKIPAGQISFDVYRGSQFDTGERQPLVTQVATGDVVVLPEGTYYIVSNYGDGNAVVRSDIRVQTGKLTDVAVNHRAAAITLKLVNSAGGEALANTEWTVLTPGGDVIKELSGAFPKFVLAEGEYRAIARNENKNYNRDFKVTTGVDGEIEVLAR